MKKPRFSLKEKWQARKLQRKRLRKAVPTKELLMPASISLTVMETLPCEVLGIMLTGIPGVGTLGAMLLGTGFYKGMGAIKFSEEEKALLKNANVITTWTNDAGQTVKGSELSKAILKKAQAEIDNTKDRERIQKIIDEARALTQDITVKSAGDQGSATAYDFQATFTTEEEEYKLVKVQKEHQGIFGHEPPKPQGPAKFGT